jgi:Ser/Thr protein kinase RdoA (MazF antagonist)
MSDTIPDAVLNAFGIRGDCEISELAGNANDNYLVQSENSKLVVKRLGEHNAENEEIEGDYRSFMADKGLPVVPFSKSTNGPYVVAYAGDNYVALEYRDGVEARGKESAVASEVAALAAKIHSLEFERLPLRENFLDGTYVEKICNEVTLSDDIVQELYEQKASFPNFWDISLPTGIVHGDLHMGNLILDADDRIVSIIDWEECGRLPVLLDIAGTVQALSQTVEGINEQIFTDFFAHYQKIRPLTDNERVLFSEALRYRSFIIYIWALMKHKQGLMERAKFEYFKERYYRRVVVPKIV